MCRAAFLVLGTCLALSGSASAGITGVIVGVADGDTLLVRMKSEIVRVDLRDVDAPDAGEPYSRRAQASLAEICRRGAVLDDFGIGPKRHVVADVHCDGVDAGAEQVKRGLARVDASSAPAESPLRALEREAKAKALGLWGGAGPE